MINLLKYIRYLYRVRSIEPRRYANLFKIIFKNRCKRILEIGTYNGFHAAQMILTSNIFYPADEIEYIGFDLFERLTEEKLKEEFSVLPPPLSQVEERLGKTGAKFTLYQEDTKTIFPKVKDRLGSFDFIFIDGGHSVETISSDWDSVKGLMTQKTVVVFDDYYLNPAPQLTGMGCQEIIAALDRNVYEVQMLEPKDTFVKEWGLLTIQLVKVTKK